MIKLARLQLLSLVVILPVIVSPSFSIDPTNPAKSLYLSCNLVFACILSVFLQRRSEKETVALFWLLTLILLMLLITHQISFDTNSSQHIFGNVGRGTGWLLICQGLITFLFLNLSFRRYSEVLIKDFPKLLYLTNMIQLIILSLQEFFQLFIYWDTSSQPIPVTTMSNPNYVSAILGISGIGCVHFLFESRRLIKFALVLQLLANVFLMTKLQSSQGFIILGLGFGIYSLIQSQRFWYVFSGLSSLGKYISVVLSLAITFFFSLVLALQFASELNLSARLDYWRAALRGIIKSPLVGNGFGSFGEQLPSLRDDQMAQRNYFSDSPHNIFLEIGYSVGLPVMVFTLWLWAYGFVRLLKFSSKSGGRNSSALIVAVYVALTIQMTISPVEISLFILMLVTLSFSLQIKLGETGSSKIALGESSPVISRRAERKRLTLKSRVAFLCLSLISLPIAALSFQSFVKDHEFRRAIERGDGRELYNLASSFPVDRSRYKFTIEVLMSNEYLEMAKLLAQSYILDFPNDSIAKQLNILQESKDNKN